MNRIIGLGLASAAVAVLMIGVAVWAAGSDDGSEGTTKFLPTNNEGAKPGGTKASFGISGIITYTVRNADGNVTDEGTIHND